MFFSYQKWRSSLFLERRHIKSAEADFMLCATNLLVGSGIGLRLANLMGITLSPASHKRSNIWLGKDED